MTQLEDIAPIEPNAKLLQSACYKQGSRDSARAGGLLSKQMQEIRCRLAQAAVHLQGEGYEALAIWLHSTQLRLQSASAGAVAWQPHLLFVLRMAGCSGKGGGGWNRARWRCLG
jgi:hypothetical protein